MKYRYATLDVFTGKRFAGNPLAVVFDADGMASETMQAIAREFNLSETVFVLKPAAATSTASVRIFTPAVEMPFAGHPTVGTAVILARETQDAREIVLEEKIGLLRCTTRTIDGARGHARFTLPQLPQQGAPPAGNAALAAAIGLHTNDIGFDGFAPARWSAGNAMTFVPVRSIDAIRRCKVDLGQWDAAFEAGGRSSAFVFCRETLDPANAVHARMFAPRLGVLEDPATGSAVAAFAGLYAAAVKLSDGDHKIGIEQGFEMGRPSLIELTLTIRGGKLASAAVGGTAIVVSEGRIEA